MIVGIDRQRTLRANVGLVVIPELLQLARHHQLHRRIVRTLFRDAIPQRQRLVHAAHLGVGPRQAIQIVGRGLGGSRQQFFVDRNDLQVVPRLKGLRHEQAQHGVPIFHFALRALQRFQGPLHITGRPVHRRQFLIGRQTLGRGAHATLKFGENRVALAVAHVDRREAIHRVQTRRVVRRRVQHLAIDLLGLAEMPLRLEGIAEVAKVGGLRAIELNEIAILLKALLGFAIAQIGLGQRRARLGAGGR